MNWLISVEVVSKSYDATNTLHKPVVNPFLII